MKIDLGETIRKRVLTFPALEEGPIFIDTEIEVDWGRKGKTKGPKKGPPSWGLFPPFTLTGEQLAGNLEYRYPASFFSPSLAELAAMTDRAINVAKETVDAGDWELWLYATSISPAMRVRGRALYEIRIIFVFRARRVFFAPAETPSGSIAEIPKEPTPEDLEKKSKEEVKNE